MSLNCKDQLVKRWVLFVVGMFLMGTGIALIIKANMGVSPISSFTTVMNEIFPSLSLGAYSFIFSVLLFFGEIILAPKQFGLMLFLQLIPSAVSGVFIDVNMALLGGVNPDSYGMQAVVLVLGCLVFGLSLALMVSADVLLSPTEGFISVFANRFGFKWGNVKSGVDLATVVLSAIICFAVFHGIHFIREGTLISAVLIGQFSKLFQRWSDKVVATSASVEPEVLVNSKG